MKELLKKLFDPYGQIPKSSRLSYYSISSPSMRRQQALNLAAELSSKVDGHNIHIEKDFFRFRVVIGASRRKEILVSLEERLRREYEIDFSIKYSPLF